MKKILFLLIIFLPVISTEAQQERSDTLAQYLLPAFSKCVIRAKNGTFYSLLANYNVVSGKMVFIRNGAILDLANPETVDTVNFDGRRFVPREAYFVEAVYCGKVSVYIKHSGKISAPEVETGYGTKSESSIAHIYKGLDAPQGVYNIKLPEGSRVKHDKAYFLRKGEEWIQFLNENQLIKAFPGHEKELRDFIRQNKLKLNRVDDLVRIGKFCSSESFE